MKTIAIIIIILFWVRAIFRLAHLTVYKKELFDRIWQRHEKIIADVNIDVKNSMEFFQAIEEISSAHTGLDRALKEFHEPRMLAYAVSWGKIRDFYSKSALRKMLRYR